MNDAMTVRCNDGIGDLRREIEQTRQRQASSWNYLRQRPPFDLLHRDEVRLTRLLDGVHRDNVWMVQGGNDLRFAFEPLESNRI